VDWLHRTPIDIQFYPGRNTSLLRDCIAQLNEGYYPVDVDYAGVKGVLDNVIVIWQSGITRDAIAREQGAAIFNR
jgi:hypothetical protein